jgi:hypothetical protein
MERRGRNFEGSIAARGERMNRSPYCGLCLDHELTSAVCSLRWGYDVARKQSRYLKYAPRSVTALTFRNICRLRKDFWRYRRQNWQIRTDAVIRPFCRTGNRSRSLNATDRWRSIRPPCVPGRLNRGQRPLPECQCWRLSQRRSRRGHRQSRSVR